MMADSNHRGSDICDHEVGQHLSHLSRCNQSSSGNATDTQRPLSHVPATSPQIAKCHPFRSTERWKTYKIWSIYLKKVELLETEFFPTSKDSFPLIGNSKFQLPLDTWWSGGLGRKLVTSVIENK